MAPIAGRFGESVLVAYLVRRALTLLPILLLVSIIVFALIRMIPGDPIDVMCGGEDMAEAHIADKWVAIDALLAAQAGFSAIARATLRWAYPGCGAAPPNSCE